MVAVISAEARHSAGPRVESVDPDLHAGRALDRLGLGLEHEQSVAAGDTEFDDRDLGNALVAHLARREERPGEVVRPRGEVPPDAGSDRARE